MLGPGKRKERGKKGSKTIEESPREEEWRDGRKGGMEKRGEQGRDWKKN